MSEEKSPELSLQDLAVLKSVIEAATTRGAIKPKELKIVGEVYDRLCLFLEYVNKQQQQANNNTEEEQ